MRTVLFSWVMLSMVVGVAAASSGRNSAWLLALVISPLLARLLLLALPSQDRTAMASIYSGGYRLVSLPQLEGSRPSQVDIRPRDPNSRSDRLLDSSACASVLGRYSSRSTSVECRSR
jgi:hypothetical protein